MSSQSRLDACFDALELSIAKNHATMENVKRANKVVKKLKNSSRSILYKRIGEAKNFELTVYSDASFANLSDGVSSGAGYVVFLTSSCDSSCALLDWSSVKIQRKVESTLEAEAIALRHAIDAAVYMGHLVSEFYYDNHKTNHIPIRCFTDNRSAYDNIHSTKQVKSKRLRIDMAEIKRMLEVGEVAAVDKVFSKDQLADSLTKQDVKNDLLDIVECGDFDISR